MPETYHEDVLAHLESERVKTLNAVNKIHEIERNGDKYTTAARTGLVNDVQTSHPGCSICAGCQGNPKPEI